MRAILPSRSLLYRLTPVAFLVMAVSAAVMLIRHLFAGPTVPDQTKLIKALADSARAHAIKAESVVVVTVARTDTVLRILNGAPGPVVAAAERAATEALSRANASEENVVRLRLTYDVALVRKDSLIGAQSDSIERAKALVVQIREAHAATLLELGAAKTQLNVIAMTPKPTPPCGFYCTTGKVTVAVGTAYVGYKYIDKYGLSLPH